MKVVIQPSGVTAKDDKGNIYKIQALVIRGQDGREDTVYWPDEWKFKMICEVGTRHPAEIQPNMKIIIV